MDAPRNYYHTNYVNGSTARNLEEIPDYTREEYNEQIQRANRRVKKRKQQQAEIDFVNLIVLSIAIVATLIVCIQYLMVQSDITSTSKDVANLENTLMNLTNDNNEAEENLDSSIDLAYIYKVATKELGMVHADKNQVITYESNKSDYVRQYSDIPDSKASSILGH